MGFRFAVDTGGTFTDLVIEDGDRALELHKSPTTLPDPTQGVVDVFEVAATARGIAVEELLGGGELLIHASTRAINAVLTQTTPRTALLTTEGHEDILLLREGGREGAFDFANEYPRPFVARSLTFGVRERVGADGEVVLPLDDAALTGLAERLAELRVEAVAVCLLWSTANPIHELQVGELLARQLPDVAVTLSHQLNPSIREFRRASSTALDAALKPVMTAYLAELDGRLRSSGFEGRILMTTSSGGLLPLDTVAAAPAHTLNSGPAMAPVAGRFYADRDTGADTVIVADTGGTTCDISLVRGGEIPRTREAWLGRRFVGIMTGLPSVEVRSVGAGGGSIARVDEGGLLHVGPDSAGGDPGPACYGRGGDQATVTDAALVLGCIDPDYFLGSAISLDAGAALAAVRQRVAEPLGLGVQEASAAIFELATENVVSAIEDVTVKQGVDPRQAVLVGGGGAAGLNLAAVARRLGCRELLFPETGAALSAAGALLSDLSADFMSTHHTSSGDFDYDAVNSTLSRLEQRCDAFIAGAGQEAGTWIEWFAEARYPRQIWELEVPLPSARFRDARDVEALRERFHDTHERVFAIRDPDAPIEIVAWRARAVCRLGSGRSPGSAVAPVNGTEPARRPVYFRDVGSQETAILRLDEMRAGEVVEGPAVVESALTSIVVTPGATVERLATGALRIVPDAR
jgi:N-methylhydantoinase A